jgi:hypothetical protein
MAPGTHCAARQAPRVWRRDVRGEGRAMRVGARRLRGSGGAGRSAGRALFTHAPDEMGRVAATNALSRIAWRQFHQHAIPAVTYTSPEVVRVGLTEDQPAAIPGARVAELPLDQLDRAITAGRTDGYIKLITAPRIPPEIWPAAGSSAPPSLPNGPAN